MGKNGEWEGLSEQGFRDDGTGKKYNCGRRQVGDSTLIENDEILFKW